MAGNLPSIVFKTKLPAIFFMCNQPKTCISQPSKKMPLNVFGKRELSFLGDTTS